MTRPRWRGTFAGLFPVVLLAVFSSCSALLGDGGDGGTGGGGGGTGGGSGAGWHAITMPTGQDQSDVRGVWCSSTSKCVIATKAGVSSDPGALFAASDTAVGAKLLDGKYPGPLPTASHTLGDIDFTGFTQTRNGVVARITTSGAYVSATGDVTQPSSWSIVDMGTSGGSSLPGNEFQSIEVDGSSTWVFINLKGYVYSATAAPGPSTVWTPIWSPTATPSVPADFATQKAADPSLCDSDVSTAGQPSPSNPNYVSQDLTLMLTPTGGLNEDGTSPPGVCISTDKGRHFRSVAFTGVPSGASSPGPIGVTCLDANTCLAFNGLPFQAGTAYVYYTSNAAQEKNSTWTQATLPSGFSTADDVTLQAMFFAPDGQHGWLAGNKNHHALLLRTTDGGKTWSDVSGSVLSVADHDLYNGFALDQDHVWLVGRYGTLIATSTAQQ